MQLLTAHYKRVGLIIDVFVFFLFPVPGFVNSVIDMLEKKGGLHIWHAEMSCVQREAEGDPHMILGVGSEAFSSPCH